jgi:hypothetical protein
MRPWTTTVAVHGGPRAAAAEGLTGAHTRGRSGERGLTMSWGKGGGELRGVLTEGFDGWFDGETRPAVVKLGVG